MRILIIEDELLIAEGLISSIEEGGNEVAGVAYTGLEGIQMARTVSADLILTDIRLPDISGLDVISVLEKEMKVPFVILTAYSEEVAHSSRDFEMLFGFLTKPVDATELSVVLNIAMNRFKKWKETLNSLRETKQALENRKLIERAKGVLMDCFSMKEMEAMKLLQKKSKDSNRKLVDVAQDILKMFGT